MSDTLTLPVVGAIGTNAGAGSDGVLVGALTAANPTVGQLESRALTDGKCITDDGGTFVDESTPFNEATADDVELLPAAPAVDDAVYFGHLSKQFARVDINLTTQGIGSWALTWEYWNGSAWATLAVTDGTSDFVAAVGFHSVTFTIPSGWTKSLVDNTNGFFIRARVSTFTSVTTAPQAGQGFIVSEAADAVFTDDLVDLTDVGTGDVALLPAYPVVGDGFYVGAAERFCKLSVVYSQARTGTATITWLYWNGSAWVALPIATDDSVGFSATAGTHLVHFVPPDDWEANTASNGPGGEAGYHVKAELTAITTVTQQPLGTSAQVFPVTTGATGVKPKGDNFVNNVQMIAGTVSAANADSIFALINTRTGLAASFTWTQALAIDSEDVLLSASLGDELVLIQVQEDGTTEFADVAFLVLI